MAAATPKADAQAETTDPVCGEIFPPSLAVFRSEHAGHSVSFCSKTCKETFDADPDQYPLEESTE